MFEMRTHWCLSSRHFVSRANLNSRANFAKTEVLLVELLADLSQQSSGVVPKTLGSRIAVSAVTPGPGKPVMANRIARLATQMQLSTARAGGQLAGGALLGLASAGESRKTFDCATACGRAGI